MLLLRWCWWPWWLFPGGEEFQALQAQGHSANSILRGHKGSMYEGGHRVPTIVRYPKEVAAGSTCDANVCHTDFFATFAEFFGATIPEEFAEDISEIADLTDKYPEIVAELKQELILIRDNGRSNAGKMVENYVPEDPWIQVDDIT